MESDHSESESDESEELYPIIVGPALGDAFIYKDPLLVSGVLRAVVEEDLEKIKELVSTGYSLNINDNNGNTPLHVAVIKNNLQILRLLVSQEDIRIDKRNLFGETALSIASRCGHVESAKILIENGANVNLADKSDITPLHGSVQYPLIAYLLIKNGAKLDFRNEIGDTPLHDAVSKNCLETVCMLLYYGADANALGTYNLTPFMKALINKTFKIQETLLEYVDDYNARSLYGESILNLALKYHSPFTEEILQRGGDVDVAVVKTCAKLKNAETFKLVWNQSKSKSPEEFNMLSYIFKKAGEPLFSFYLDVILKGFDISFFENVTESLSEDYAMLLYLLLEGCVPMYIAEDRLTQLIFLLLQNGFQLHSDTLNMVYRIMGFCDLFKLLLYIDFDYIDFDCGVWKAAPCDITSRLIFDVHCDLKSIFYALKAARVVMNDSMLSRIKHSLKYWIHPPLIDLVVKRYFRFEFVFMTEQDRLASRALIAKEFSHVPKVPKLLQLARDMSKTYLINKFNINNTCQYYTLINHMDISSVYKKILTFETPMYDVL